MMNLALMRLIDQQFLETPFYGVRQLTRHQQNEGHAVNEKRIRRLMRLMRLMPIYQKPDTSRPAEVHKTCPYLLGGLRVERPNQVWCADITYLPMRKGFLDLVAIMDWLLLSVSCKTPSKLTQSPQCADPRRSIDEPQAATVYSTTALPTTASSEAPSSASALTLVPGMISNSGSKLPIIPASCPSTERLPSTVTFPAPTIASNVSAPDITLLRSLRFRVRLSWASAAV
ncbi:MAG: hypothetical protein EHM62_08140 [Methylococcus sp.]|nr:MAG: hypothetical protein EHM62_08140 [Methylococcus sp.]